MKYRNESLAVHLTSFPSFFPLLLICLYLLIALHVLASIHPIPPPLSPPPLSLPLPFYLIACLILLAVLLTVQYHKHGSSVVIYLALIQSVMSYIGTLVVKFT